MTTLTETPVYHCRNESCRREIPARAGASDGYCGACRQRWYRAGKPEGGPPPVTHPERRGGSRVTKAEAERRMAEYARLRGKGFTVVGAAAEMGISVSAAEHYATKIRARERAAELAALPPLVIDEWPVPAPVPGVVGHWSDAASCRGHGALMFAPDGESEYPRMVRERKARSLCAVCPVMGECREAFRRDPRQPGTWAGVTDTDREKAKTERRNASRRVAARREGVAA